MPRAPESLRSARWFARKDFRSFNHRSRMLQAGYDEEDLAGRPIIAILNTWSDINPCHGHLRERARDVKRGIDRAGGLALELPAISLFENLLKPSALVFRNLLAMEVEEMLRAYPIDGVVLMGGCDKSTPGLLLGAISAGLPAIFVPAGPMLRGNWRGAPLGSGSDAFRYWDEVRAGTMPEDDLAEIGRGIARSYGTCMTMGTASTMMAVAEAIGMSLPGSSSIPAVDAQHLRMCAAAGRRIVEMVWEEQTPARLLSRASFENGIAVAMAMGCSTNAVIHIIALARRAGIEITLDDFDRVSRRVPVIANVRPSGDRYLMEDFHFAGGLPALMSRLSGHLDLAARTVSGRTIGENVADAVVHNDNVIRPLASPLYEEGALAVLRGNIAPDGAILKPSSCDRRFLRHSGPALVFDDYPSLKAAVEDDNLDVTPDHVLILRNAGPLGGPGMPEWGMLPIPKTLLKQGIRDMVRISDARMSGTSYGACILHVSPEAYLGAPLALVRNGDMISLDVPARRLDLAVSDSDLAERRSRWQAPPPRFERGYGWMASRHIRQAHEGCDFDFLETGFGAASGEPDIF